MMSCSLYFRWLAACNRASDNYTNINIDDFWSFIRLHCMDVLHIFAFFSKTSLKARVWSCPIFSSIPFVHPGPIPQLRRSGGLYGEGQLLDLAGAHRSMG